MGPSGLDQEIRAGMPHVQVGKALESAGVWKNATNPCTEWSMAVDPVGLHGQTTQIKGTQCHLHHLQLTDEDGALHSDDH